MKELKLLKEISRNRISGTVFITKALLNDSFTVKSKGLMVGVFKRLLPAIGLGTTKFRLSIICKLVYRFSVLYKQQGMKGLVTHLKAATVILQQSLGGFRLHDMSGLNTRISRGAGGLPRMIPNQDRVLIAKGNTDLMRFYLTIFNLYRILEFPGKIKLSTITDAFEGNKSLTDVYDSVFDAGPDFAEMIVRRAGNKLDTHPIKMTPILKSAPGANPWQSSSHPFTMLTAARLHKEHGTDAIIMYFAKYFEKATKKHIRYPGLVSLFQKGADLALNFKLPSTDYPLGKLGLKNEPAGKVRVFAMVDSWTNWVLGPLHEEIFRILRTLPTDGTFDQLRPVLNYTEWPGAYSLDLTAATDRLPISLQIHLLSLLYGKEFAVNWSRLLVEREYSVEVEDDFGLPQVKLLTYAVGQPMGALSSWAMLALTHHYIVNVSAWQSGLCPWGQLYSNYAILGDDLVIGDRAVKDRYLLIVDSLGVKCGLHKSLLSTHGIGIEFAKKTFYKGIDVSPVPLLEFITATWTLPAAIAFAHKYKLTLAQLVKTLGFGYKVLGGLDRHIGVQSAKIRMLIMAFNSPSMTSDAEQVSAWLGKGNPLLGPHERVCKLFMEEVVQIVQPAVKKAFSFITSDYITKFVSESRTQLWRRFGLIYLQSLIPSDYFSTGIVKSDGVKTPSWTMATEGTVDVPPSAYNRIENDLRDVDLWITRVLSNQVGPQVEHSRDTIDKLLSEMTRLGRQNTVAQSYIYSLEALKAINNVNVITQFKRVDDELRPRMDVVQIKL